MNLRALLFLFLTITGFSAVNAQQRKCEMAIQLLSPSEAQIIQPYAQYALTVRITNNGPNDLLLGDTLWYNTPSMPLISYATFILQQPISAGNSADITFETDVNNNTNTQDETATFYATVVSRPDGMGALKDTFLTNNTDANTVTFKPCDPDGGGGTSVNSVNAKDLNIQIYPNPSSDFIQVKMNGTKADNVLITDVSGRAVLSKSVFDRKDSESKIDLNITALNAGLYFIKIETDKGIATAKFVKK